jgi:hypothetical protein
MKTMAAFIKGEAAKAAGNPVKVFDWNKAAEIIKNEKPSAVAAGLSEDWEWTGGDIYKDGRPVPKDETYTYLASVWATPEIDVDGDVRPCFVMADETEWNSDTYWPQSALDILNA